MDIIEQIQALNSRISNLESTNAELMKRVVDLNDQNQSQSAHFKEQLAQLQLQLDQEVQQHAFTRLELEDEQRNVALGVKMLRELQGASGDVATSRIALQEKDSTITRLQSELAAERELRAIKEKEASNARQEKEDEFASRTALKAMVSILTTQLRQSSSQLASYESVIGQQKEEIGRGIENLKKSLEMALLSPSPPEGDESRNVLPSTTTDRHVEELDNRFKSVLELIEEAEGRPLTADVATPIKASIREAKQAIGEEIIIAHSNIKLESLLRHNADQQLQNERKTSSALLAIISDLQAQVSALLGEEVDEETIRLSFVRSGPMVLA